MTPFKRLIVNVKLRVGGWALCMISMKLGGRQMETKSQDFIQSHPKVLDAKKLPIYMYRSTSLLCYNSVAMQLICVGDKDFRFNSGLSMSVLSIYLVCTLG